MKYQGANIWSRRLTGADSIVYMVSDERINFLQTLYHYSDRSLIQRSLPVTFINVIAPPTPVMMHHIIKRAVANLDIILLACQLPE